MKDLHARTPVDRKAAEVVGPGSHYIPQYSPEHENQASVMPIQTTPRPINVKIRTGRYGRLTIVGYFAHKGGKANGPGEHRWVVRCDCGRWAVRKWCALTRKGEDLKACGFCCFAAKVKRMEEARRQGIYLDGTPIVGVAKR